PRNRINKHYLSRIQNIQNRVEDEFNETEKQKDFINKRLKLFLIINNKLGFNFDSSTYRESNNSYSILATKKTFGGEFAITVDGTPDNIKLKMFWFDHGECKFQEEIKINQVSASNENKFESCIEEVMPYLFKKALLKRDEIKNKEYRDNFHTVEISRNDFASIYKQLREPYVVNNDTEICGNWFQSIYDLNNGVLKMHNLQNPKLHTELRVTGTKCELIPPIDGNWDNHFTQRNRLKYLNNTFDDYELSHLISLSNYKTEEEKSRGGWLERISGKCFNFNWHKHPDSYIEPSSGDLCSSGQIGNFNKYLPLPVITFGIVVKKEAYLRKYGHLYPNAVEIKGRDYGGSQDYVMSYWKVLKQEGVSQYNPSRDLIPVNIRVVD
ncbi:hypothetical protein KAZ01_01545, partial [Candidatus Gracilibacteria bacterium]|nr:hypothetical protein [Candidatus Gracilibacteria bacterium]